MCCHPVILPRIQSNAFTPTPSSRESENSSSTGKAWINVQSARKKFRLHLPNELMNYGRRLGVRGGSAPFSKDAEMWNQYVIELGKSEFKISVRFPLRYLGLKNGFVPEKKREARERHGSVGRDDYKRAGK